MAETTEQYRTRINQIKTNIEQEPEIRKMRDDIAEGVSKTGNRQADIEVRQNTLEDDFVAVQQDASSASPSGAEVAVARGSYPTLDERLTKKEQEVTAQLAQKVDLAVMTNTNKQLIHNKFLGLRKWKSALSTMDTGTGIINLNVIGTSIACGGVASDYINKSWVGLLRKALSKRYEDVGNGFVPTYQKTTGDIDMWSFNGTWVDETLFGVMGTSKLSTVVGSTATLTFNGTGVRIVTYRGSYCGKFLVSIDGGAPVEFDSNGTTSPATHFEITGLVAGEHTMVITQNEADKLTLILGAYALKGSRGVRVNANAKFGGNTYNAVVNNNVLFSEIDYWQPTLTIIEFMTNDYFGQIPLATFKANMQTLITRAKTFGDVVLLPNGIREETKSIKQTQYLQVLKELAYANDIVFMDIFNKWGGVYEYTKHDLGYLYDTVHPNDNGHFDIGSWLIDTLF